MNGTLRTTILLAGLMALFAGVGFLLGGSQGMVIALVMAGGMNLWAWWNSDRAVLRMHNAQPIGPGDAPRLHAMVRELAARAGLPMPALYVIHEAQPNAFATGRDPRNAAVAVTAGLLEMMPEEEVAGVVAHELAHIRHRDTLIMTVTACLAGAIGFLAHFGGLLGGGRDNRNPLGFIGVLVMIVVAPLMAMLVQMAISRAREYEADRLGAQIAGGPRGLANALLRLEGARHAILNRSAEAHPESAPLFIVNPLSGQGVDNLFSTHPSTENRVRALLGTHGSPMGAAPMGGPGMRGYQGGPQVGPQVGPQAGPWSGGPRGRGSVPPTGRRRRGPWG